MEIDIEYSGNPLTEITLKGGGGFSLPKKLSGRLRIESSDGPRKDRNYENPGYILVEFLFFIHNIEYRYCHEIPVEALWAEDGTEMVSAFSEFCSAVGILDGMMDTGEVWNYINAEKQSRSCLLKHTSFHLEVEPTLQNLRVGCRYYDQSDDIADYVTIFYSLDYDKILFLHEHLYDYDEDGVVEDVDLFGGTSAIVEKISDR